ncbi:cell division protein FtsX [Paraliomyxa miuraensis]|uniref:cell division protein FtsX n=1 Tax=Paraliomyxa miuraensis TaxID=376150 RepID=UPI0022587B87|nr:permease-like cell division protein FtsX [Paraliomyxa miuraensis]MCX4241642.1 permease-like cell division protein FtsX [Paraliomyxa miuraensis]
MSRFRPLFSLGYVVSRGLRGMAQAPVVQLLAVSTMAVCMLLLGVVMLVWSNAQGIVHAWGLDVPVTVYLVDHAEPAAVDLMVERIGALPEVTRVERVSSEQALERLAEGLGEDGALVEGLDPAVLPPSLEIELAPGIDPDFGHVLAEGLAEQPMVEEVAVAGAWAGRAHDLLRTLEDLALGAGLLVSLACMAIVWSTIRLGVYARRAELQILRLVGGTDRFVHGPFVFEGMVQGALGAGLALGILWVGFDAAAPFLERGLSLLFAGGALRFFSPQELAIGVALGAGLGLLGARAAVGRYAEV